MLNADIDFHISEYMHEHQSLPRRFGIRVCHSRDMSREQLQLLAQMCPKLTHVSLYVDEDMGDLLTPLTELKGTLHILTIHLHSG